MAKTERHGKRWIWWLIGAAGVLLLLGLAVLLIGHGGASAAYDDVDAILRSYDADAFSGTSILPDGTAEIRMEKEDILWFADQYGFLEMLRREMTASSTLQPDSIGFRLADGDIRFYCAAKIGGMPLSFRSVVKADYDGTALNLHTEKLILGASTKLPELLWPEFFRGSFSLNMEAYGITDAVTDMFTEGGALVLRTKGLGLPLGEPLQTDGGFLTVLSCLMPEGTAQDTVARSLCKEKLTEIDEAALHRLMPEGENAAESFIELLACCTEESRAALWSERSTFTRQYIAPVLQDAAAARREVMETALSEELGRCERTLSSVRELYKAGLLQLGKTGIRNAPDQSELDLASLSSLPITSNDAGVVLLCTERAQSRELRLNDMPTLADVPHDAGAFPREENERVCDVGVTLESRGGVPLLISYRADGTMTLRVLDEATFVALLTQKGEYRLSVDDLPPSSEIACPSDSAGSGAVLLIPEE